MCIYLYTHNIYVYINIHIYIMSHGDCAFCVTAPLYGIASLPYDTRSALMLNKFHNCSEDSPVCETVFFSDK